MKWLLIGGERHGMVEDMPINGNAMHDEADTYLLEHFHWRDRVYRLGANMRDAGRYTIEQIGALVEKHGLEVML